MKLSEICSYISEHISTNKLTTDVYVSTENMLPNREGLKRASSVPNGQCIAFKAGDVLVSNIRPYFKKIWRANCSGGCSADVLCIRPKQDIESLYLYYLLSQDSFFDYVMTGAKGCKMPRGDKHQIMNWDIKIPSLEYQKLISHCLSSLDSKIELNRRINDNLEQLVPILDTFINDKRMHEISKIINRLFKKNHSFKNKDLNFINYKIAA